MYAVEVEPESSSLSLSFIFLARHSRNDRRNSRQWRKGRASEREGSGEQSRDMLVTR